MLFARLCWCRCISSKLDLRKQLVMSASPLDSCNFKAPCEAQGYRDAYSPRMAISFVLASDTRFFKPVCLFRTACRSPKNCGFSDRRSRTKGILSFQALGFRGLSLLQHACITVGFQIGPNGCFVTFNFSILISLPLFGLIILFETFSLDLHAYLYIMQYFTYQTIAATHS